jgi:hypothetical protein
VNPWNGAEPESAEEAEERDLFARRARALGRAEVGSLASVLRAARVSRDLTEALGGDQWSPAASGARVRTLVAVTLAAACMTAAVTRLPRTRTSNAIAPEIDASSPHLTSAPDTGGSAGTAGSGATCFASDEVLVSEEAACFSPALFTSTSTCTASVASMTSFAPPVSFPAELSCEASE